MPRKCKPKLPPDPEEMNNDRAGWAAEAIMAFRAVTRTDLGDAVSDLLADLGHWCDRNGIDFKSELNRAALHYHDETAGEGKQLPEYQRQ